jgi:CheY-like chemotaxis protein
VEYARTIYASGADLLSLINEVLDLSKVEAGKMVIETRALLVGDILAEVRRRFEPLAAQKGLRFVAEVAPDAPEAVLTDPQRLQQILRNLLSNAFKFTDRGSVALRVRNGASNGTPSSDDFRSAARVVAFDVSDTGIGIPEGKKSLIFEAFQQADGSTSRKYGGTGLGLSISRELAHLLDGEIDVASEPGKGSTFTLYLPESAVRTARDRGELPPPQIESTSVADLMSEPLGLLSPRPIEDDRTRVQPGDRVLLVIDDDEDFARILLGMGRNAGFKTVIATRGDTGLALAAQLRPSAITLDVHLPVYDGWTVLDRLKRNPLTRHIPVQMISVVERTQRGAVLGAFAYLEKPVTKDALEGAFAHLRSFVDRAIRQLLLVEDNDLERSAIARTIEELGDVEITRVRTGEEALSELDARSFDCMVVDLVLPGLDGVSLVSEARQCEKHKDLPIVVYTGKELDVHKAQRLKALASTVIVKQGIASLEQLANDTSLFLHRVARNVEGDTGLAGKKVLIVDDDVRNIFALSSALEAAGLRVVYAEDGRKGLEALSADEPDVVIMDIMMPQMDGYAAIRAIRELPGFESLPIIAVTARALQEDRDRCLQAGASDYMAKPVDLATLLQRISVLTAPATAPLT